MKQQNSLLDIDKQSKVPRKQLDFNPPQIVSNSRKKSPFWYQLSHSTVDIKTKNNLRRSSPYFPLVSKPNLQQLKAEFSINNSVRSEASSPVSKQQRTKLISRTPSREIHIANIFPDISVETQNSKSMMKGFGISEMKISRSKQTLTDVGSTPEFISPAPESERDYLLNLKAEAPSIIKDQGLRRPVFSLRKPISDIDTATPNVEIYDKITLDASKLKCLSNSSIKASRSKFNQQKFEPSFASQCKNEAIIKSSNDISPNKLKPSESIAKLMKLEPHRFAVEYNSLRKIRQNTKRSRVKKF